MQRDAFETALEANLRRRPFRPFTIELESGRRLEVDYPGALNVRDGVAVLLAPGGVPHIFDYEGTTRVMGENREASN